MSVFLRLEIERLNTKSRERWRKKKVYVPRRNINYLCSDTVVTYEF